MHRIRNILPVLVLLPLTLFAGEADDRYDPDKALQVSQAAVGRTIGDYEFVDTLNRPVRLREFAGKPLVISMIFTSCHHVCPMTTKHLDQASEAARDVLGEDSFRLVTIGFDTQHDTPQAMSAFAREQGVDADGWHFLSGSEETVKALAADLGFIYFPTPRGFDHINQISIIDRESKVYNQVYGVNFELPWLVEPLKQLVFNRPESVGHAMAGLVDRVRLFCTVFNPSSGRYEFDNSLFIQIAIGFIALLSVAVFLWKGIRPSRQA